MTEEKKLFLRTEEDGGSYERENVDFKLRRRFALGTSRRFRAEKICLISIVRSLGSEMIKNQTFFREEIRGKDKSLYIYAYNHFLREDNMEGLIK